MALTRFFEEQIRNTIINGIPIPVGPGEFLALAGEDPGEDPNNCLTIFDFARVPIPLFEERLGQEYNAVSLNFVNNTDYHEYCSHLISMTADDEPLFVIKLQSGRGLAPGETFTVPAFSVYTETFEDVLGQGFEIFDTKTLPFRAISQDSSSILTGEANTSKVTSRAESNSNANLVPTSSAAVVVSAQANGNLGLQLSSVL